MYQFLPSADLLCYIRHIKNFQLINIDDTMMTNDLENQEALQYAQGTPVKLKNKPDRLYIVAEYDPMMVPPIWLVNDPKPHYPHELELIIDLFCPVQNISKAVNRSPGQLQPI
jgi:hypothetical protein